MKKLKIKKILMTSFGFAAVAGLITTTAIACKKEDEKPKQNNNEVVVEKHFKPGSGTTFIPGYKTSDLPEDKQEQGLPKRNQLNEREKALLDLTTKQWYESIPEYTSGLLAKTRHKDFYKQITDPNGKRHFATTKDSGSIDQMDIAYAFGISPHYAAIKHTYKNAQNEKKTEYTPVYLEVWKKVAQPSTPWVGNIHKSTEDVNNLTSLSIGTILTTTTRLGGYSQKFSNEDPKILGYVAQSRSTDILSKRPARLLPNWLFWADQNDPTQTYKVGNSKLASESVELAGNPNWYLDPYEPLINAGQMLDSLYDASKFENMKNAEVNGKRGFTTFEEFARANVDVARKNVSKWAKENASKANGKTFLVVNNGNESVFPTSFDTQEEKDFYTKNFYAYIPTLFPMVYASPNDQYTPGLGYEFPRPKRNLEKMQEYVDDYGWFGGKTLVTGKGEAQATVGKNISDAFEKEVDVITFVYNPSKVQGFDGSKASLLNFEQNLTNFINNIGSNKDKYNLTKMLKENPVVGKNFFIISKDEFYDAGLAFVGTTTSVVNFLNKVVNQNLEANNIDSGAYYFNELTRGAKHIEGIHARDDESYKKLMESRQNKK